MDRRLTAALLLALVTAGSAQDLGKRRVEEPIKTALVADLRKSLVEAPLKAALLGPSPAAATAVGRAGRVAWHASFDAALAAAKHSKKPVLLFQLLGRLDDELC